MSRSRPSRSTSRNRLSHGDSQSPSFVFLPGNTESLFVADPLPASEHLSDYVTRANEATSSTIIEDSNDDGGIDPKSAVNIQATRGIEIYVVEEDEEIQEREEMIRRPFYKRPSPWWMLGTIFLGAIATSVTIAPRVELYTALACQSIKPEYTGEGSVNYQRWNVEGTVPPPSETCAKDPEIQAAVARLITVMTVSAGILSCITTGWWGQLSDRYGRTRILCIATIGLLATDFNFIIVSRAANHLPGRYRFLLVGPVFDGLLGGMSTLIAGKHAYISDCTPTEERSRFFSLNTGLLFCGMALGPALAGQIIRSTNDLLSVFYLATSIHLVYGFFVLFIIPESLPESSMLRARKRRETQRIEIAEAHIASRRQSGFAIRARTAGLFKASLAFLGPLSIFLPSARSEGRVKDWNLLLLALSQGFYALVTGSYQFKFQFAQREFGWNSEQLGYWLSVVSTARATYLVLILPLIIKIFKPQTPPIQLPVTPSESLNFPRSSSESIVTDDGPPDSVRQLSHRDTSSFDLSLTRASLGMELTCYTGMTLAMSSTTWTVTSILSSSGSGFSPALHSVALALYEQGPNEDIETGRLFGGLSVIQSLSTQIIGPSIFGLTYVSTVNTFPKGIFVVGAAAVACALFCISFVRLMRDPLKTGHDQEETAVVQGDE